MAWIRACGGGSPAIPDGRTVTPINDVTIWQQCAGIANPTYTTLAEVLADTGILQTLMASDNAVDYLARSKQFIGNIALVPIMTSNTTPSGECSASSVYSAGYDAYRAFDADDSTEWWASSASNEWVQYQFASAVAVNKIIILPKEGDGSSRVKNFKVKASNDGVTFTDLYTGVCANSITAQAFSFVNNTKYIYYRCLVIDGYVNVNNIAVCTLTFTFEGICQSSNAMTYIGQNNYASNTLLADSDWRDAICNSTYFESVLNVKVPTMTSNTTPSGVVSASAANPSYPAWQAFDNNGGTAWSAYSGSSTQWIQYQFTTAKTCIMFRNLDGGGNYSFTLKGSNDANTWTDLKSGSNTAWGDYKYPFANQTAYKYYRLTCTVSSGVPYLHWIQFYGREDV